MRKGSDPCKCRAYPFPYREGGGRCEGVQLERRYANAYWASIFRVIGVEMPK